MKVKCNKKPDSGPKKAINRKKYFENTTVSENEKS